jgi:hypothetical protein
MTKAGVMKLMWKEMESDFCLSLSPLYRKSWEDVITEGNDSNNNCLHSHHWMKLAIH